MAGRGAFGDAFRPTAWVRSGRASGGADGPRLPESVWGGQGAALRLGSDGRRWWGVGYPGTRSGLRLRVDLPDRAGESEEVVEVVVEDLADDRVVDLLIAVDEDVAEAGHRIECVG